MAVRWRVTYATNPTAFVGRFSGIKPPLTMTGYL